MATEEDEREVDFDQWLEFYKLALDGAVTMDLEKVASMVAGVTAVLPGAEVTIGQVGQAISNLAAAIADAAVVKVRQRRTAPVAAHRQTA